jgi:hypothetical protein
VKIPPPSQKTTTTKKNTQDTGVVQIRTSEQEKKIPTKEQLSNSITSKPFTNAQVKLAVRLLAHDLPVSFAIYFFRLGTDLEPLPVIFFFLFFRSDELKKHTPVHFGMNVRIA